MSYQIIFWDPEGDPLDKKISEIEIFNRNEFFLLTDQEKTEYLSGPKFYDHYDPSYDFERYIGFDTFLVEKFLDNVINSTTRFLLEFCKNEKNSLEYLDLYSDFLYWDENILETFINIKFPIIWEKGYSSYPKGYGQKEHRNEYFLDFVYANNNVLESYNLFKFNTFYKDDFWYEAMILCCQKQCNAFSKKDNESIFKILRKFPNKSFKEIIREIYLECA